MNFGNMKEEIFKIKEIKPIGKTIDIGNATCHVMGMILQTDGELQLSVLEYDDDYYKKTEQSELDYITDVYDEPITNRVILSRTQIIMPSSHLFNTKKIYIGETEFATGQSGGYGRCSQNNWNNIALFTHFLVCGWNPAGIDTQDIDYMFMARIPLDGKYSKIPDFNLSDPIRFELHRTERFHPAEKPLNLVIDGSYDEKIYFTEKNNGTQYWIQINRVFLYDMWGELEKLFEELNASGRFPKELTAQNKSSFESDFSQMYPKNTSFIAVEYECQDDICSVEFHSRRFLDKINVPTSKSLGIISKSEQPIGKLGKALKTAFIQEPFPSDTKMVEAELFGFYISSGNNDITL